MPTIQKNTPVCLLLRLGGHRLLTQEGFYLCPIYFQVTPLVVDSKINGKMKAVRAEYLEHVGREGTAMFH